MTFDFYSLCAKYWQVDREVAKFSVLDLYYDAGGNLDFISDTGFQRIAQMQPLVLDRIPNEARVEMLAHYGIVLGDN